MCGTYYREYGIDEMSFCERLEKTINDVGIEKFFSQEGLSIVEKNKLDNIIIKTADIPQDAVSIIECMDEFEIKQQFAKIKGFKDGEYICSESLSDRLEYNDINELEQEGVKGLFTVISSVSNIDELQETYDTYKNEINTKLKKQVEQLKLQYSIDENSDIKQQLLSKKHELLKKEEKVLTRDFMHKKGIDETKGLKTVLMELRQNKEAEKWLLESDKEIKEDELQYQSNIHGVSHTRRVNFLANVIMNMEGIDRNYIKKSSIREIVEHFVINHDIGRINDIEDKQHGQRSVELLTTNPERLKNLDEEDKEIVKFTIKQHSLSAKENEKDIQHMFVGKKYTDDKETNDQICMLKKQYIKRILDICKDADKLDRVRLDPLGIKPREGLDVSRLSLDGSKQLEGVAYESLDKILEILDIEHEIADIDKQIDNTKYIDFYKKEISQFSSFEQEINKEKEKRNDQKKEMLSRLIADRRLSKITDYGENYKSISINKSNERKIDR